MLGPVPRCLLITVTFLTFGSSSARADFAFNFESSSPTTGGARTLLTYTNSGLTMDVTRPGSSFDVVNNTVFPQTGKPASWGARSLDPFAHDTSPTPFVLNFSQALDSFKVEWGDYGADVPDTLTLKAYSGLNRTGTLLGTATENYFGSFPSINTTTVSAPGLRSIELIGGSALGPNSVFYDNFSLTALGTPEPSSLVLCAAGGLSVLGHCWRARRRTSRVEQSIT